MTAPLVLMVRARQSGGTYIASCMQNHASCTMGPDHAAQRAAAKAFSVHLRRVVLEDEIQLTPVKTEDYGRYRFHARLKEAS